MSCPSTGLVYMQQRYYDPVAGRFLSVDPIATDANAASFNRYAYVSNDPLGRIDPNGEWDACEHGATCAVLDFTGIWTAGQALAADAAYLNAVLTNNVEVQNQVAQELADNKGDLYKMLAGFAAGYGAGKVAAWAVDAMAGVGAAARGTEELLSSAGRAINDTGLSRAAQKLSSHAQRQGGTFPKPFGSVAERNAQAQQVLRGIVKSPDAIRTPLSRGGFEVRLPNGQGARFEADGSFTTFLDPKL
jgi:RHS repeat-associated protein